jgi:hypothetical protein
MQRATMTPTRFCLKMNFYSMAKRLQFIQMIRQVLTKIATTTHTNLLLLLSMFKRTHRILILATLLNLIKRHNTKIKSKWTKKRKKYPNLQTRKNRTQRCPSIVTPVTCRMLKKKTRIFLVEWAASFGMPVLPP